MKTTGNGTDTVHRLFPETANQNLPGNIPARDISPSTMSELSPASASAAVCTIHYRTPTTRHPITLSTAHCTAFYRQSAQILCCEIAGAPYSAIPS
jgi:hypothetical protein